LRPSPCTYNGQADPQGHWAHRRGEVEQRPRCPPKNTHRCPHTHAHAGHQPRTHKHGPVPCRSGMLTPRTLRPQLSTPPQHTHVIPAGMTPSARCMRAAASGPITGAGARRHHAATPTRYPAHDIHSCTGGGGGGEKEGGGRGGGEEGGDKHTCPLSLPAGHLRHSPITDTMQPSRDARITFTQPKRATSLGTPNRVNSSWPHGQAGRQAPTQPPARHAAFAHNNSQSSDGSAHNILHRSDAGTASQHPTSQQRRCSTAPSLHRSGRAPNSKGRGGGAGGGTAWEWGATGRNAKGRAGQSITGSHQCHAADGDCNADGAAAKPQAPLRHRGFGKQREQLVQHEEEHAQLWGNGAQAHGIPGTE
jgi:hypothetical protein